MKRTKKIIASLALTVGVVSILSSIAYASVPYDFTLPSTGSKYTDYMHKPNSGSDAYNYCSYVGWSDTINCWVNSDGGSQITSTSSYSSAGNIYMHYPGGLGRDYYGHNVQMQIKTGSTVFHEINVRGSFQAS